MELIQTMDLADLEEKLFREFSEDISWAASYWDECNLSYNQRLKLEMKHCF